MGGTEPVSETRKKDCYTMRLETENARLTAIVEGLPDEDEIWDIIDNGIEQTFFGTYVEYKIAEEIHARLHNPTISKMETVDTDDMKDPDGDSEAEKLLFESPEFKQLIDDTIAGKGLVIDNTEKDNDEQ